MSLEPDTNSLKRKQEDSKSESKRKRKRTKRKDPTLHAESPTSRTYNDESRPRKESGKEHKHKQTSSVKINASPSTNITEPSGLRYSKQSKAAKGKDERRVSKSAEGNGNTFAVIANGGFEHQKDLHTDKGTLKNGEDPAALTPQRSKRRRRTLTISPGGPLEPNGGVGGEDGIESTVVEAEHIDPSEQSRGDEEGLQKSGRREPKRERKRKHKASSTHETSQGFCTSDIHSREAAAEYLAGDTTLVEAEWAVSKPSAGRILEVAASFSADERYLLFATEGELYLGSIDSSTVERSLPLSGPSQAASFTITNSSNDSPDFACLGTSNDDLLVWGAQDGKTVNLNEGIESKGILSAVASTNEIAGHSIKLIFSAVQSKKESNIFVQNVRSSDSPRMRILKQAHPILFLRVSRSGRIVVVLTSESILIGALAKGVAGEFLRDVPQNLEYSWREIPCPQRPACANFRVAEPDLDERNEQKFAAVGQHDKLDVAFGSMNGRIYLYSDVLSALGFQGQSTKKHGRDELIPREMRWHREWVAALAFSPDGNYLVSGGQETVLVLWQLDTARMQFLPHLESPIRSLSISPSGSLYAIGTADNSIMVLSTAEMTPIAHFASLQSPSSASLLDQRWIVPKKEMSSAVVKGIPATALPSLINPQDPSHILLAAPSQQAAHVSISCTAPPAPYLQAFDTIRNVHISRQALTRTNATNTNTGPDGVKLLEPNIAYLGITPNGRWLATVDEWSPPVEHLRDTMIDRMETEEQCARHREIHLRFWRWDTNGKQWMLNTDLPSPHEFQPTQSTEKARILAFAMSCTGDILATVGEDRMARMWAPKTRRSDGKIFRGDRSFQSHESDTWWELQHAIPLEGQSQDEPLSPLVPNDAKLAWSGDGSLIAAWLGFPEYAQIIEEPSQRLLEAAPDASDTASDSYNFGYAITADIVYFIDVDEGTLREARADMLLNSQTPIHTDKVQALSFAERYLLILSSSAVHIWDLPLSIHLSTITIPRPSTDAPSPFLAVNHATRTFAIATPHRKPAPAYQGQHGLLPHAHRDFASQISVYSLPSSDASDAASSKSIQSLFRQRLPHLTLSLLSAGGDAVPPRDTEPDAATRLRKGYVIVDSNANIRRVEPPMMSATLADAMVSEEQADAGALEADGADTPGKTGLNLLTRDMVGQGPNDEENGETPVRRSQPRVVPSQKLAEAVGAQGEVGGDEPGAPLSVPGMFKSTLALFWGRKGNPGP